MEKLEQMLNITNANGEVITFFDGKVTLGQIIAVILCIVVVGIAWKFIKGLLKTAIMIVVVCVALVYFGIASPEQITDVAGTIKEYGVETYQKFADASENIKVAEGSIQINLGDKWVDISEIGSMVSGAKDTVTVNVNGESYTIEDSQVLELLDQFK